MRNVRDRVVVVLGLWAALALCASADTIVGSPSAAFQTRTASDLNEGGNPYWDNTSWDGSNINVGFFLIDAPTAHLPNAPGALPYWGNAFNSALDTGGAPDLDFFFERTTTSSSASLKLEVAADANINEFGWYDKTQPSVLHPIFLGSDSAPTSLNFSPSPDYGLYVTGTGGTYHTQSSLNPAGETSHQHFAVFQESTPGDNYWIGLEDLSVSQLGGREDGRGDYNDMLIRISSLAVVPDAPTIGLVTGGILFLVPLLRRRN